jgi:hypothetical protein
MGDRGGLKQFLHHLVYTIEHSQFHRLYKRKIKKAKRNQDQLENREKLKTLLVFQLS